MKINKNLKNNDINNNININATLILNYMNFMINFKL